MARYNGTVVLTGKITPTDTTDTYPTHEDILGKGGYRSVNSIEERDNIPEQRLSNGMLVYVIEDDVIYIKKGPNWEVFSNSNNTLMVASIDNSIVNDNVKKISINTDSGLYFENNNNTIILSSIKGFTEIQDENNSSVVSSNADKLKLYNSKTIVFDVNGSNSTNGVLASVNTFVYTSETASVEHIVEHNLENTNVIADIFKITSGATKKILVDYEIIDDNKISIQLTKAENLKVVITPA